MSSMARNDVGVQEDRERMTLGEKMPYSRTTLLKKKFLEHFLKCYMVGPAAKAAGTDRATVSRWRRTDKAFAEKFEKARSEVLAVLEDEAFRRAYKGVGEPVFYKGEECGEVQKFSDRLLVTLLKAYAPEKYGDKGSRKLSGEVILKIKYDDAPGDNSQAETPA
jgi:hypothetical protein